jgi:CMP/dCMP kinase
MVNAGVGKSFLAKELAKKLDITYIDTGAMYRAFAYYFYINNIEVNEENIKNNISKIDIKFEHNNDKLEVYLNNKCVTDDIREHNISMLASNISAIKIVRNILVEMQRNMAKSTSVVLEGRDIGSVVFPDAFIKFYIECDIDIRAKRRCKDYKKICREIDLEIIKKDLVKRDIQDTTREESPLVKVSDAITIDTSNLSKHDVVEKCYRIVKEKLVNYT